MPFYDFHCKDCRHEFELKLSIEEKSKGRPACPSCGSSQTKHVYGTPSVVKSLGDKQTASCPMGGCCSSNRCGF